jgi:hypothetical protein
MNFISKFIKKRYEIRDSLDIFDYRNISVELKTIDGFFREMNNFDTELLCEVIKLKRDLGLRKSYLHRKQIVLMAKMSPRAQATLLQFELSKP